MNNIDTSTLVLLIVCGVNVVLTLVMMVIVFSLGDLTKNLCGYISDLTSKVENIVDGSKRIERICDAVNQRTRAQSSNRKTTSASKNEVKRQPKNNGGKRYGKKTNSSSSSSRSN